MQPYPCTKNPCTFWSAVKKRGRLCPEKNCEFSASDIFYFIKQKTIDSAICVDALNLAQDDPESWVAVFSSDYDIVPGIIGATRYSKKILRFTRSDKLPKPFSQALMHQMGVIDKIMNF